MFFLTLLSLVHCWKCSHNSEQVDFLHELEKQEIAAKLLHDENYIPEYKKPYAKLAKASSREPIRIFVDYQFLDGADPKRCREAGEWINWGSAGNVQCKQEDIMTPDKKKLITQTMDNVVTYLNKLLKVNPVAELNVGTNTETRPYGGQVFHDKDLYIAMYGRPFGDTGMASSGSYFDDNGDSRPKKGHIMIRTASFSSASNVSDTQRQMFEVLLHEVCHILGIGHIQFSRWINPDTGIPYHKEGKTPVYKCVDKYNIERSFVTNSIIKKYIKERFGNDDFGPDCQAGIELEDDGGDGSEGSHPEARAFPREFLRLNTDAKRSIISSLSLTLLQATGHYDVDMSMAELLTFGDPLTNGGVPIKDFSIGSPQRTWPEIYQFPKAEAGTIGYGCYPDLRARAKFSREKYNCDWGTYAEFCQHKDYYDPDNNGYAGTDQFREYVIDPEIDGYCTEEYSYHTNQKGATHGPDSMCFNSSLTSQNSNLYYLGVCHRIECKESSLIVHVGNVTAECKTKGQKLTFPNTKFKYGELICPDPVQMCKLKELKEVDYDKIFNGGGTTPKPPTQNPERPTENPDKPDITQKSEEDQTPDSGDNSGDGSDQGDSKPKGKINAAAIAVPIVLILAIITALVLLYVFNSTFKEKVNGIFQKKNEKSSNNVMNSSLASV
ncbi:hypothetical protein TRFO_38081 [Tritrichomonas foetus]|uniref:GP63-like n=1 Tax=Tritrichomonas foetus TaxID=1144522 RepID=A0A1J4J9C4_9EUKA|nr:hypothetical protein TRFO_38081 [Tritrichomonas foetus]|eukprot:OHS95782.1 hypothetical protein TRFO_38081 [Tritrichomonas foetus]